MEDQQLKIERLSDQWGRFYRYTKGDKIYDLYSVTTILAHKKDNYLLEIEKSVGKEKLEELGKIATQKGTCMHVFLENYFEHYKEYGNVKNGIEFSLKHSLYQLESDGYDQYSINEGRKLFWNFYWSGFIETVSEVYECEKFLVSTKYWYAGTMDFLWSDNKRLYIASDFKSGKTPMNPEKLDKYYMQLAAYIYAANEQLGTQIKTGSILYSYDNRLDVYEIGEQEIHEQFNFFKIIVDQFYENRNIQREPRILTS
jgi:hypothetical protein